MSGELGNVQRVQNDVSVFVHAKAGEYLDERFKRYQLELIQIDPSSVL